MDAAFDKAQEEDKPVLLYWGAAWCPPCHELKAKVFSRREFIEKTKLFVPVYVDGDDPGAQKWSETFNVRGYPTVLVLRADRGEIVRLTGGLDMNQYAGVLDLALNELRPIENIIAALKDSAAQLSLDDCKRLAYGSYMSARQAGEGTPGDPLQDIDLRRAIERCPPGARVERARLTAMYATWVGMKEGQDALRGKPASQELKDAIRALLGILADRKLARAVADITVLDESSFDVAERLGVMEKAELRALRQRWIEAREAEADDPALPVEERLQAFQHKLMRAKTRKPADPIPELLAAEAHRRVAAALASTQHSAPERVGVVGAVLSILNLLGDTDGARAIIEKEIATAAAPYYYMSKMAHLEEGLGNEDAAGEWFRRAYEGSKGPATRFRWGVDYVGALIRLRPNDETTIRDAVIQVLGELRGPDRLHGEALEQLEALEAELRRWNSAGKHEQAIAAIRGSMERICEHAPSTAPSSRQACAEFLARQKA